MGNEKKIETMETQKEKNIKVIGKKKNKIKIQL